MSWQQVKCFLGHHDWLYADGYLNTLVDPSIEAKCSACDHQDYHPASRFQKVFKAKGEAAFHPDLSKPTLRREGT